MDGSKIERLAPAALAVVAAVSLLLGSFVLFVIAAVAATAISAFRYLRSTRGSADEEPTREAAGPDSVSRDRRVILAKLEVAGLDPEVVDEVRWLVNRLDTATEALEFYAMMTGETGEMAREALNELQADT